MRNLKRNQVAGVQQHHYHCHCYCSIPSTITFNRNFPKAALSGTNCVNYSNITRVPLVSSLSFYQREPGVEVCYINAQSCRNKTLAISDQVTENDLDIMALCETWLKPSTDACVGNDLTPTGYAIKRTPRPTGKGGGVAIIHKSRLNIRKRTIEMFRTFEHIECTLNTCCSSMRIVVMYREDNTENNPSPCLVD